MANAKPSGALANWYERTVGTPTTDDEVTGYWVFALGVVIGILGVAVFTVTAPRTTARSFGYALAAAAPPLIMIGAIVRFPLRRIATAVAAVGGLLTALGIVYFLIVFPEGWAFRGGNTIVNLLYGSGVVLIGLAGVLVPLVTDPVRADYERMQAETTEARTALEASEARVGELEDELATRETELSALRDSSARFELYPDRADEWRWRLRHRNGNVIADSGEGYSSERKATQGLHSVKRNALGAGLLRLDPASEADATEADAADDDATESAAGDAGPEPEDAAEPAVAVPTADHELESQATFELFEDDAGDYRWRLVHDNGNVIADSGEGYDSKSNARRALDRVREHVAVGDYLEVDPVAFEVYRDRAGDYRWRLLHENGNVLADSGEGYASRQKAEQGLESVRGNAGDAEVDGDGTRFEVYADARGDHRWRLVHRNGNVIADSGEGYSSRAAAEDAVENVRGYVAEADVVDAGAAAFEIYEDAAEEWRWRLRHRNGNVLADSGEGYASRSAATEAVRGVKRNAPGADEEETA